MATNLILKSKRQVKTDILSKIITLLGLNDVNGGSVLDVLTDAVAQEDFAQYVAMAQIARLVNLDNITGTDLDNKAFEYGLTRDPAVKATGLISILRATGFVKVATTFYAGSPAPITGNTTIDVNNASNALIGNSGTLILGRGTANQEEVTYSAAPVNNTNFWRFTVSPLANNHSVQESVILKQGVDQTIIAGTTVNVPASGTSAAIAFSIDEDVTLLAGEAEVDNVAVTAVIAGTSGNISTNQIFGTQAFSTSPFPGAQAVNPAKFTTGADRESDDSLRDAIRNWVQSLSRGVKAAIKNAIVGLVDPVTAKRVVSANIILPQTVGPVLVYFDDGTGFEPTFAVVGFEEILAAAAGKEGRLQLDQKPLVKAQLESNSSEPFNMSGGNKTLSVNVGSQSETITFTSLDFEFPNIASAYEIVAAINSKASLIEARTANSGTQIVITAVADINEAIQVTGGSANSIINFPTDLKSTLSLYVDDMLLSKDGTTALIDSGNQSPFNFSAIGASPWLLNLVIDGKTANPQVITFQASDFMNPASATVLEVVKIINAQVVGAVAQAINSNTKVRIVSNTLLSNASQIHITSGTANDATNGLNFSTTPVIGINGDYTLNRELGTIQLKTPLLPNQSVTAGSIFTRGKLRAATAELYSPSNGQTLVISIDGGSNQTVTFDGSFVAGQSAAYTAAFINKQLKGATAYSRSVGLQNFLEISTNSYGPGMGSIQILSTSTGNAPFQFQLDTIISNQRPNRAYQLSGNAGPFRFAQDDSLIVILDNDIVNKTFAIQMDYSSSVSSPSSTTIWSASALANVFQNAGDLVDYYVAFTAGPNTLSGSIASISNTSGNTWRYVFASLPSGLTSYAAGDLVKVSGMADNANNGNFVITAVNTTGAGYIEVTNILGVANIAQTGTALMSQSRQITAYSGAGGTITVGSAFSNAPASSAPFIVIPSTVSNLTSFMNNLKVTAFSLQGFVEGAINNTKLQLASQSQGSDGYIQVSGGQANLQLGFPVIVARGLPAYDRYVGLTELVHKTIYGDDSDLVTYPGVGAAGITFYPLAPTVREVKVEIQTVLKPGIAISSVQNSVKSAISGYINNLGVGDEVVIEEIRAAVIAVPGLQDVVLNLPLANIPVASNELARTKSSLIKVS